MLEAVVDLQSNATVFAVATIPQKWAGLRTRLHAGRGLMDNFALASVGKLAVGAPQLDLCIALAAPNRSVTATPRVREWLGLASKLNEGAHLLTPDTRMRVAFGLVVARALYSVGPVA